MNWIRCGVLVLGLVLLGGAIACAKPPRSTSMLDTLVTSRMRFKLISGRIVNTAAWHFGNGTSRTSSDATVETITFRGNGVTGSLNYRRMSPAHHFSLEVDSENLFHFRRNGNATAKDVLAVEFTQPQSGPISLAIDREGRRQVFRATTLWHLLIAEPEACRQHVIPVMETLRPRWQLSQTVAAVEAELLKMADGNRVDRRQWAALVEQLGDGRFAKREAADRELRASGAFASGYLAQLDFSQLDAEQQFRVRRIVKSISLQTTDDSPEQVAASLVEDPGIWLALLARPEESTRRLAVRQLATILGESIPVDPAADPAGRSSQREQLRVKIESGRKQRRKRMAERAEPKASEPWCRVTMNSTRSPIRAWLTAVPPSLYAILAVGLALRLLGAWCAHLIFDERAHWALAETIDLVPCHLHLVSRTLDHPLLSIYVLKLGSLVLGTSDFALRLPYVLAGTATILPVYFLGVRAFSQRAGLWAAALVAVDQFHAGWSRVFMPEVLMLLLVALAMLQFLRLLDRGTMANYVLLGVLLGLAYLAKEPAILLVPALWITVLVTPAYRPLLRQPRWYLAHAVFLLVIAPDILWNVTQWTESYLHRDAVLASASQGLSLKPLSLYLGDWFRMLVDPNVLGEDYLEGNLYVCHAVAGALYLAGIVAAVMCWRMAPVRWLLVVFLLVVAVFLVLPGGGFFEPFWWASISLIPAVVCAGAVIEKLTAGSRAGVAIALVGIALLTVNEAFVIRNPGPYEARATVEQFVQDFTQKGFEALDRKDLREAEGRFVYVLNIGGPHVEAYYGLAWIASERGQWAKADRLLQKGLRLDPQHRRAVEWQKKIDREDREKESSRGH